MASNTGHRFAKAPKLVDICAMLSLLLLLPFLGFISLFIIGKRGNVWAGWLAVVITLAGFIISVGFFLSFDGQPKSLVFEWVSLKNKNFTFSFQLDSLGLLMLLVVHFVALLVQLFSIDYMRHDAGRWRYFAFLQLFIFAMLGIVLAGNLLLLYVFWELVGFASYLLIGFWFTKPRAVWAAKKAFILNRIGDAGFLMGILLLLHYAGTTDFAELNPLVVYTLKLNERTFSLTVVGLLIFCGCVGKSAQWPLSSWLPDAMEGPTPVSALIHAATMVAAGIFLLARIHFLLTPTALLVVTIIGTITMFLGAYRAVFQTDIKKLLAYSTISQLGLMVLGMGVNARTASLFHLMTHAFFKAGLFLCAGAVIHYLAERPKNKPDFDSQDMRQMGNLRKALPVVFVCYTFCAAALAGLPLFSGFLSKEAILGGAFDWANGRGGLAYLIPFLGLFSAGLTAFYVARQWRLVFLENPQTTEKQIDIKHKTNFLINFPLVLLACFSVFIWFSFNPFDAADGWLFANFPTSKPIGAHWWVAATSVVISTIGGVVGYRTAYQTLKQPFSNNDFWPNFDKQRENQAFIIPGFYHLSRQLHYFDQRVIDLTVNGLGYVSVIAAHVLARFEHIFVDGSVNALAWLARLVGNRTRSLQNGQIQSYFVVALLGLIGFIIWFST